MQLGLILHLSFAPQNQDHLGSSRTGAQFWSGSASSQIWPASGEGAGHPAKNHRV